MEHDWTWMDLVLPWGVLYLGFIAATSLIFSIRLPRQLRKQWLFAWVFFFNLQLCIPLFGCVLGHFIARMLKNHRYQLTETSPYILVGPPDYQRAPVRTRLSFGESSSQRLQHKQAALETKQDILIAVNRFQTAQVNRLNRALLQEDVDELRLSAQSLMEKQERAIFKLLAAIHHMLVIAKTPLQRALLKKAELELMWEQILKGLVDEEGKLANLVRIRQIANDVMTILPNDAAVPMLMVHISLRSGKEADALYWINVAKNNHCAQYKLVLTESEIAFQARSFEKVKQLMHSIGQEPLVGAHGVLTFWSAHA